MLALAEEEKKKLRWKTIAMVFQNSLDVLNPVMKWAPDRGAPQGSRKPVGAGSLREAGRLLELVGLEEWKMLIHQLSGGMRQQVLWPWLSPALPPHSRQPASSLDAVARKALFETVRRLQDKLGFSCWSSPDLSTMKDLTDKLMVLYSGEIMERGLTREMVEEPAHTYTRGLINSSVQAFPYKDLWGIPGEAQPGSAGCAFAGRCTQASAECTEKKPSLRQVSANREVACHRGGIVDLLKATDISKSYRVQNRTIAAVSGVSMRVRHGETLALVG